MLEARALNEVVASRTHAFKHACACKGLGTGTTAEETRDTYRQTSPEPPPKTTLTENKYQKPVCLQLHASNVLVWCSRCVCSSARRACSGGLQLHRAAEIEHARNITKAVTPVGLPRIFLFGAGEVPTPLPRGRRRFLLVAKVFRLTMFVVALVQPVLFSTKRSLLYAV